MNTLLTKTSEICTRATELSSYVVDILDNVVLCKRADDTYITWQMGFNNGSIDFYWGHYDMDEQNGRDSLIARSTYYKGGDNWHTLATIRRVVEENESLCLDDATDRQTLISHLGAELS